MLPQMLIVAGAGVFGLLGAMHLYYTFFTDKFDTRDPAASIAMKATSPILTSRTSMWKAWIGFNASHSLGVLLFAVTYLILAVGHMSVLRDSPALAWLSVVGGTAYVALSRQYWFRSPLIGTAAATGCFLAAALVLSF